MNTRQYKKLCKRSATLIGTRWYCEKGLNNIYQTHLFECLVESYYSGLGKVQDAWPFLVDRFIKYHIALKVPDKYGTMRYKFSDIEVPEPTPANVFAWAREEFGQ